METQSFRRPYALFDMDGTLLDSMDQWMHLDRYFLDAQGLEVTPELQEQISEMHLHESMRFLHEALHVGESPEANYAHCLELMAAIYRDEVTVKAGVQHYLEQLQAAGIKMALVTATPRSLAEPALERHGLMHFFEVILSIDDVGKNKKEPLIYDRALEMLGGTNREEAVVYEDAGYALSTAVAAGFKTVLVEDPIYQAEWPALKAKATWTCSQLDELDFRAVHAAQV